MNFQAILQNRNAMIGIIVGVVLLAFVGIFFTVSHSGGENGIKKEETIHEEYDILNTDSVGKALEIQALLARENINVQKTQDGSKIKLFLQDYKPSERDRAILKIVQSGLMDKNVGLEIFDKSDFTATKDDKRIRLARAINGELSRLIKQIPPIEDASVFVSIAEPTMFTAQQKPTTATVQLVMPSGEKLEKEKVRAVTNLLLGSVQGLEAANISITDTNGNVYSSLIGPEDDIVSQTEENDKYMTKKVQAQLDRLLGKGNYVVTVSTYLREVPEETSSIVYDPKRSSVLAAQKFTEALGDKSADTGSVTSAVSSYLPDGMPQAASSAQNRRYARTAEELQYGATKSQITEYKKPGILEEITIALTVDQGTLPMDMNLDQLKELVARAASPKANAKNVQIAFSNAVSPYLASERPEKTPAPEDSGNPWWTAAVLLGVVLLGGLVAISNKVKAAAQRQQDEIRHLHEQNMMQENQLKDVKDKAASLIAQQEQMQRALSQGQVAPALTNLQDSINIVRDDLDDEFSDEEAAQHLKSWIESSN